MTIASNTHHLRPAWIKIVGAAKESRAKSIKRLLDQGLLRDHLGRKLIEADIIEVEQRLKARRVEMENDT